MKLTRSSSSPNTKRTVLAQTLCSDSDALLSLRLSGCNPRPQMLSPETCRSSAAEPRVGLGGGGIYSPSTGSLPTVAHPLANRPATLVIAVNLRGSESHPSPIIPNVAERKGPL